MGDLGHMERRRYGNDRGVVRVMHRCMPSRLMHLWRVTTDRRFADCHLYDGGKGMCPIDRGTLLHGVTHAFLSALHSHGRRGHRLLHTTAAVVLVLCAKIHGSAVLAQHSLGGQSITCQCRLVITIINVVLTYDVSTSMRISFFGLPIQLPIRVW